MSGLAKASPYSVQAGWQVERIVTWLPAAVFSTCGAVSGLAKGKPLQGLSGTGGDGRNFYLSPRPPLHSNGEGERRHLRKCNSTADFARMTQLFPGYYVQILAHDGEYRTNPTACRSDGKFSVSSPGCRRQFFSTCGTQGILRGRRLCRAGVYTHLIVKVILFRGAIFQLHTFDYFCGEVEFGSFEFPPNLIQYP